MSEDRLAALEQRIARLEAVIGGEPIEANEERLIAAMLRVAARLTGLDQREIYTQLTARHARARFAVIYAARETLGYSLHRLGRALGRDASSARNGLLRAHQLRDTDPMFRILADRLVEAFRQRLPEPEIPEVRRTRAGS